MDSFKIIIADDHDVVREGIRNLIKKDPTLRIVGEANNGEVLLAILKNTPCDLIVIDIVMPEMDGLAALKIIKRSYPKIKVLVFSMLKDYEHFKNSRVHGASGYLTKDDAGDELITAIKSILKGKEYISSSVTALLAQRQMHSLENGEYPSLEVLTKREKQILALIAKGMANKNIAVKLKISIHTVENHRANLSDKLGLNNTASLVKYAIAKGLA